MTPGRTPLLPVPRRASLFAAGVIVLAALAAYANSFAVPFIFDDAASIAQNASIRHLARLGEVLKGPPWGALTVNDRPLLNLSLAFNYAAGGLEVGGYHGVNLAIHVFAGLILFGVVRRSLRQPPLAARFGEASLPLALCVALLWILHPLQTEAVTYVIQRAESLLGLCYLLTLYTFIRGTASPQPWKWHAFSLICCTLGMMAKEVMVSAPLMVLLYDRTFVAGSFGRAWHERRRLYAGLGCTWLVLGWLMLGPGGRSQSVGFENGIPWYEYALTQFTVITRYLGLALWPFPLIFDHGGAVVEHAMVRLVPSALIILTLVGLTVMALRHRPVLGFLGCWFFGILAPTSSVVPLADTMFEHRMYLPLAAVIMLSAAGVYRWAGRRSLWLFITLAVAAGMLTAGRNEDYRSEMAIWLDTVAKQPDNARAYNNLGTLWLARDNLAEAESCFAKAVQLRPTYPSANYNLGIVLARTGRDAAALGHFITAIQVEDGFVDARINAGNTLLKIGRAKDAIQQYEIALRLQPDLPDLHYNLGLALDQLGRPAEATREYEAALRLNPAFLQAQLKLAETAAGKGDVTAAEKIYRDALRLQPGLTDVHLALGDLLAGINRFPEAIEEYQKALVTEPGNRHARFNLGNALLLTGRIDDAIAQYERIPDDPDVAENLRQARAMKASPRRAP